MSNVLCVYENVIATVSTMKDFFESGDMARSGIRSRFVSLLTISNSDAAWCDVLFLIRPNHPGFSSLAKKGMSAGKFVVVFCDDDLLNLPVEHPRMPWRKAGLINALRYSDVVLSSSPYICERFIKYTCHNRYAVTNTAVPQKSMRNCGVSHDDDAIVKIVYAAGVAHAGVFNRYILPVMPELCKKYAGRISLTCMGVHPDLHDFEEYIPIKYIESLPLHRYRERIAEERFDIGLAPLAPTEFAKAKYFNKFIEYAMMGIVGIYSNTEPYTFVIEDGKNGILADNTPCGWLESISRAIDSSGLRNLCRETAYGLLKTKFAPDAIVQKLVEDIPELVEYGHEDGRAFNATMVRNMYKVSLMGDWMYKFLFYMRREGFLGVRQRIKAHIG